MNFHQMMETVVAKTAGELFTVELNNVKCLKFSLNWFTVAANRFVTFIQSRYGPIDFYGH